MLKFVHNLEMIPQEDEETPIREFARPHITHEFLFANGTWGFHTDYFQRYDTRTNRQADVDEVDPTSPRAYHGTAFIGFNIYTWLEVTTELFLSTPVAAGTLWRKRDAWCGPCTHANAA
jgi:hypothetical protein